MVLDRDAGKPTSWRPHFDRSCQNPRWADATAPDIRSGKRRGGRHLLHQSGRQAGVDGPAQGVRAIDRFRPRPAARSVLAKQLRSAASRRRARTRLQGPILLDHFNDALAGEWKLGKVESKTFKGADDKDVQQWIVYPPDFDATKKWPFVQVVHGGPHSSFPDDWSFRWNLQLWAAQGYIVGAVNFHGSSGYGQDFTHSIIGALGDKPLTDVLKSTEWFAQQPWIDKNRMAAAGGSYGGYMMAWLNGHTDLFKAMVCHAGVYDWHAMLASDIVKTWGWELGSPTWGDLTFWTNNPPSGSRQTSRRRRSCCTAKRTSAYPSRRDWLTTTRFAKRAFPHAWSTSLTRITGYSSRTIRWCGTERCSGGWRNISAKDRQK